MTCGPVSQPFKKDLESLRQLPEHELDAHLKRWARPRLEAVLRLLGKRLGTANEQPNDFELAHLVAHQLNNLLTAERLLAELSKLQRDAVGEDPSDKGQEFGGPAGI